MTDVTIIPAQPGFTIICADDEELSRGEPVIAWAIDPEKPKKGELAADVYPITPDGAPASNYVGVENPDKSVSVSDSLYESLDAAQRERREHLRAEKALKK